MLGPGVEQTAARGILAHRVDVIVGDDPVDDLRPRFPEVVRAERIRRQVVQQRLLHRDVRRPGVERRGVDLADASEVRHLFRRHVRPRLSAVARDVDEPVVGSGPEDVRVLLARPQREDSAVHLRAVHVVRDRSARLLHRLRIVTRQVRADPLPVLASVGRLPHVLRRCVEDVRIGIGKNDRIRPLPPFDERAGRLAREQARIRPDFLQLAGAAVQAREERAVVAAREEDVRVLRIGRDVSRLASAGGVERRRAAASAAAKSATGLFARDARGAAVLLRAADVIRHVLRRGDVIELAGRIITRGPRALGRRGVVGDGAPAVAGVHDVIRIVGIDPQIV